MPHPSVPDGVPAEYKLYHAIFGIPPRNIPDIDLYNALASAIEGLAPNEIQALRLRYGLHDGRTRSLREVGALMNLSGERVRQIEERALRRLRHPTRGKELKSLGQRSPG